jgi:hypothetical protein
MRLRRAATWITVAMAILVHLVAGVAGTDMQLCVCSSGVTIERLESGCCVTPVEVVAEGEPDGGCTDCHLIPLPDSTAASISVPPACPPVAGLPEPIIVATLVWPSPPAQRPARLRAHPPDQLPRLLRSVVLIC